MCCCYFGELISAYTNPAGQYYWTLQLAPERYRKILAFITALFSYFGCVFTCASVVLPRKLNFSLYVLNNPSFEIKRWHSFVTFEAINLALSVLIFGVGTCRISLHLAFGSHLLIVVTMITCLACSSGRYNLGNFVFSDYTNITGWNNKALSFIIGLISPIWCFAGLDSAVHMVDDLGVKAGKCLFLELLYVPLLWVSLLHLPILWLFSSVPLMCPRLSSPPCPF